MSISLLDVAVDLINDAKGAESKTKLYLLEQAKEIVLHREKSIMRDLAPTLFDFMIDKNVAVRKFLIKFSSDSMTIPEHMPLIFPSFLNLVNFLMHDANDSMLILIVREFQKFYEKIIMSIVSMPQQSGIKVSQGDVMALVHARDSLLSVSHYTSIFLITLCLSVRLFESPYP